MPPTTLTSRDFDRNADGARKAATSAPVFITDGGGMPTHVLLTIEDYLRLTGGHMNLAEAIEQPAADFAPPRLGTLAEFLLASPLRGIDLDLTRANEAPRDIEL